MYKNILVPTDGSPGAAQALNHALDLAELFDSTIHGLYVIEPVYTADAGIEYIIEMLRNTGEQAIADFERTVEEREFTMRTEIRDGTAYREILDYVEEHEIDLLVMGTQGRTGVDRYLLGSVTEKVVRLAPIPVLTVRMQDDQ